MQASRGLQALHGGGRSSSPPPRPNPVPPLPRRSPPPSAAAWRRAPPSPAAPAAAAAWSCALRAPTWPRCGLSRAVMERWGEGHAWQERQGRWLLRGAAGSNLPRPPAAAPPPALRGALALHLNPPCLPCRRLSAWPRWAACTRTSPVARPCPTWTAPCPAVRGGASLALRVLHLLCCSWPCFQQHCSQKRLKRAARQPAGDWRMAAAWVWQPICGGWPRARPTAGRPAFEAAGAERMCSLLRSSNR